MLLRFLQLNLYMGKCLQKAGAFIKKSNFDVVQLQEVSGGKENYQNRDAFAYLKKLLGYPGEIAITWHLKNSPESYFGNATFFHPEFELLDKKVIWLKPYAVIPGREGFRWEDFPRCALALKLQKAGTVFWCVNAHLAWGPKPDDQPYKQKQADKLLNFLKNLKEPFLLSGDFNLVPQTKIVQSFSQLARNLTSEVQISNTLNPNLHRVKSLFPPGLAVDYIFSHPVFKGEPVVLIKEDLSDHYGLAVTLTI